MGGIILHDAALPVEGYGHVINGGPGPIMLYRIGANTIRMCVDVPVLATALRRDTNALYDAVAPVLPPTLAKALAAALKTTKPAWIENRFQTRTEYGRGRVALVGDATGCTHPLTAIGISLGLLDIEALIQSADVAQYARRQKKVTRVPELLSRALYQVFSGKQFDAAALRGATYHFWRSSAAERRRTMSLLTATDVRGRSFAASFSRIGLRAARTALGSQLREGDWRRIRQTLSTFMSWSTWPVAGLLPHYRKIPRKAPIPEPVARNSDPYECTDRPNRMKRAV
jgi:2-polyprenyl-6-methoxyphenol hydroxylase-like FAD-dependent oxidoreductase